MKRIVPAIALLAAFGTAGVDARECKGVNFPDRIEVDGSALVLNGLGLRQATAFKVNVYVAALYVTKTSNDANTILASNTPKELVLQFVRDVGADDLRKGWNEGFEKNAKSEAAALKDRIATFNGGMADMKTGQRITLVHRPATGVDVNVNGAPKGTIKGDDFAKALFAIWLSDPPNPEIKAGLLGGACG